jgi:hypothetical protein
MDHPLCFFQLGENFDKNITDIKMGCVTSQTDSIDRCYATSEPSLPESSDHPLEYDFKMVDGRLCLIKHTRNKTFA